MTLLINSFRYAAAGGGFTPPTPDASFSSVKLLLHNENIDGATTLKDYSSNGLTVTRQGNAVIDSSQSKFGTSIMCDGVGDYIQVPNAAALQVGSVHEYCIECFIRFRNMPTSSVRPFSKYNATSIYPFDVSIDNLGRVQASMGSFDGSFTAQAGNPVAGLAIVTGQWYHMALSRSVTGVRFFCDGVQYGSTDTSLGSIDGGDNTANMTLGFQNGDVDGLDGWIDEIRWTIGDARYTANFTPPALPFWNPYVLQYSYRWYNDNGSESAMTTAAALNTPITATSGTNYILRILLDATGDLPSTRWLLQYKRSTDTRYKPVPLTAPALPTFQAAGTEQSGTGGVTVAWPAHLPDDIGLLIVESCGGEPVSLSSAAGFVAVSGSPSATGAGTAGTQITAYWCRATTDSMDAPVINAPGDHVYARIVTFRGCITEGDPWNVTAASVKTPATTSYSAPAVTTTVANCLIVNLISRDNDAAGAGFSLQANASLGTVTERADGGTTAGNGGGIGVISGTLAAAGASGNTTGTVTSSINAMLTIALRPPEAPIIVSASANIAASGANTTARLTAPTGKTTANFTTGRIWDDENGTDALNVAADFYTEVAWSIKAQSPATGGETYQFRIVDALTLEALLNYPVTPSLSL